jgi:hypothetical protein
MENILLTFDISKDARKVYSRTQERKNLTISEIHAILPELTKDEVKKVIGELVNKRLFVETEEGKESKIIYYANVPPYSIIANGLKSSLGILTESDESFNQKLVHSIQNIFENKENKIELDNIYKDFKKFQEDINKDFNKIKIELEDLVNKMEGKKDPLEFMETYENELKNLINSQFASIVVVLLQMKENLEPKLEEAGISEDQWITIRNKIKDILAMETHNKAQEINNIVSEEFEEIKKNLKEYVFKGLEDQFQQNSIYLGLLNIFKSRLSKLHKIILLKKNNLKKDLQELQKIIADRVAEKVQEQFKETAEDIKEIEDLLESSFNSCTEQDNLINEDLSFIISSQAVKDEISNLLSQTEEEITIILPNLEKLFPLEEFELDYTEVEQEAKITPKKPKKRVGIKSKSKKKSTQEKEFIASLEQTAKKAGDLKGYELSHNLADVMSIISDMNPRSVIIDSIKNWLNRLLVIRKHLDQNLKFLFLEDIEKWKKNYKIEKEEEEEDENDEEENEQQQADEEDKEEEKNLENGENTYQIKIIGGTKHSNKHVKALKKIKNIEYKKLKHNQIIGILSDNKQLIFGTKNKDKKGEEYGDIVAFRSKNPYIVGIFKNIIQDKYEQATASKIIQIQSGLNEIIENINTYTGKQLGNLLKSTLDVAFKKEGMSLDLLEVKVLISKLQAKTELLSDGMKEELAEKIEILNNKFPALQLQTIPHFEIPEEEGAKPSTEEFKEGFDEEEREISVDSEKLKSSFDILMENIENLKGTEIDEQIGKIIEFYLDFQGFNAIVNWRNTLKSVDSKLEGPFQDKIKEDLLKWKNELLELALKKASGIAEIPAAQEKESQEGYKSPGLTQTQFQEKSTEADKEVQEKDLNSLFNELSNDIDGLTGAEISRKLQGIMDKILDTHGYSQTIKDIKFWTGKLRMNTKYLSPEQKAEFLEEFSKWEEQYKGEGNIGEKATESAQTPKEGIIEEGEKKESAQMPPKEKESDSDEESPIIEIIEDIMDNIDSYTSFELSRKVQNIVDIILETEGYSMALRGVKSWVSKLRMIRNPLGDEIKLDFLEIIEKFNKKYGGGGDEEEMDYIPTFAQAEEKSSEKEEASEDSISGKLNQILDDLETQEGPFISKKLQNVADILLETQGAMAARGLRNWISKLRIIKEPLDDKIKSELKEEIAQWKEKFS